MRTIEVPNRDLELFEKDSPSFAELNKDRYKQTGYWHARSEIESLVKRNKEQRTPRGTPIPNANELDEKGVNYSDRIDNSNQAINESRSKVQENMEEPTTTAEFYKNKDQFF